MEQKNIADTHNRRRNIDIVAAEAQRYSFPLMAWPEDKYLLRISDLPLIQGRQANTPTKWLMTHLVSTRTVLSDSALREWITPGRAYFRSFAHHSGMSTVVELEITSL